MSPLNRANEALRAIGALFEPGDVIEIRALDVGRTQERAGCTYAGYFNFESKEAITAAIRSVDGRAEGVYVTLNRPNPELLARSANRLKVRPKNTTTDADIIEWIWFYIDADAVRPAGISATDAEHEAALQRISVIREFLSEGGWPDPIRGDSGNGGHLLYRLPKLDLKRAGDLVKRCLQALSARFSDAVVKVDEATANPSRICKLYGTMARKGDSTPDRPHRRSNLIETPERIIPVSLEALEALASQVLEKAVKSTAHSGPARRTFDVDQWIATRIEIVKGPEPYDGGRRWTLPTCPFNAEHLKPVIIELASGALAYKCLHKSCSDNGWKELRELIEPNQRNTISPGSSIPDGAPTPAHAAEDVTPLITDLSQLPSVWQLEQKLDWAVEGMIARGSVTLICAESGTGKTWLAYYLAGCVAHGKPLLDRNVRHTKVLYIDGENPLYLVKQRLFDLGIAETADLTVWGGWVLSPPPGPESSLVIEFARKYKGLIIYDSLIEFHPGSEQSSTETRAFMKLFRVLANLGATVVVLHHTGKALTAKQYRGSSDIKGSVDTAYLLSRADDDHSQKIGKITMTCFKSRLAPGQSFAMEFVQAQGFIAADAFDPARSVTEIISEILGEQPGLNQREIVRRGHELGCTKRQIENCLRNGHWVRVPGPKHSILYSLPDGGDDSNE